MKVLLATDGSEFSIGAAEALAKLAFTEKDEIRIVHVISEIPYEDDYHAQIMQVIRRVSPKILRDAAEALKSVPAKIITMEEFGYPDDLIIKRAEEWECDLVVMGASGVKGLPRVFIGSTSRSVAINSAKPVIIFKRKKIVPGPVKVLFATDGSELSDRTAETLKVIPFPKGSELTIITVASSAASEIPERFAMEIDDQMKAEAARARALVMGESEEIIERYKNTLAPKFSRTGTLTRYGDPTIEILDAEGSIIPDLIAIGSRGLRGVKGMMGSVSRRILDHSSCSVLIGK